MLSLRPLLLWSNIVLLTMSQDKISWLSFAEAMELAKQDDRNVFVYVYTNWSPLCILMEQKVFSNPKIIYYLNRMYHPVKIHAESKDTIFYQNFAFVYNDSLHANELVALLFEEVAYPGIAIINSKGEIIGSVTGYMDPKTFQSLIHYFAEAHYKVMTWEQYLQITSSPKP